MPAEIPVAVVVVRWKNGREIRECLESLVNSPEGQPAEIVMVDSGSNDGGAELLARDFPSVRVLELGKNLGFAAAANRGVSMSSSPYVALLNPDTRAPAGSLGRMVEALSGSDAAGVVPRLISPDGSPQTRWQLRELPRVFELCLGRSGKAMRIRQGRATVEIPQPAAAAWLLRRDIWNRLNGFDERFVPAWWEDVDFCRRLKGFCDESGPEKGFVVLPEVEIIHQGGASLSSLKTRDFLRIFHANLLRYAEIHAPEKLGLISLCLRLKITLRYGGHRGLWPEILEAAGMGPSRS